MRTATIADLRNNFATLSRWLDAGEPIQITRRGRRYATLRPAAAAQAKVEWPDFEARRKRNFPDGVPPGKLASEIMLEDRERF